MFHPFMLASVYIHICIAQHRCGGRCRWRCSYCQARDHGADLIFSVPRSVLQTYLLFAILRLEIINLYDVIMFASEPELQLQLECVYLCTGRPDTYTDTHVHLLLLYEYGWLCGSVTTNVGCLSGKHTTRQCTCFTFETC